MTNYADLAQQAVQFMADNQAAVDAHTGAAYAENKILRGITGAEDTGGRSLLGYSYLCNLRRGVRSVSNRAECYAITHDIFFATNFGKISLTGVDVAAYTAALEGLVVDYTNDTDVLGELLICAKCLGYWSSGMDTALAQFETQWAALDRTNFAENYHPILVGGILFSMM